MATKKRSPGLDYRTGDRRQRRGYRGCSSWLAWVARASTLDSPHPCTPLLSRGEEKAEGVSFSGHSQAKVRDFKERHRLVMALPPLLTIGPMWALASREHTSPAPRSSPHPSTPLPPQSFSSALQQFEQIARPDAAQAPALPATRSPRSSACARYDSGVNGSRSTDLSHS
jgi:hypothetical protein